MEPRVLYVVVILLLLKYWATIQALKETFHSTDFYFILRITKQLKINYDYIFSMKTKSCKAQTKKSLCNKGEPKETWRDFQ